MGSAESRIEDEIRKIERAIETLDEAVQGLAKAADTVDRQLETHADAVAKPNYRRAEQQIRTALNAAAGAQRSLRRRLELRRAALQRERRAAEQGED